MKWKNSFVQRKFFFIYLTSTKSIEKKQIFESQSISGRERERGRGGQRERDKTERGGNKETRREREWKGETRREIKWKRKTKREIEWKGETGKEEVKARKPSLGET